jgi:hypothetical protein
LVSYGASIDAPYEGPYSQYHGFSPLGFAASYGKVDTLQDLIHQGANVNHQDFRGRTALHLAVQSHYGNKTAIECIRMLLNTGIDIETRDFGGYTATNLAMSLQDIDCLQILRDKGTNPSPPFCDLQEPPNDYSVQQWPLQQGWTKVVNFLLPRLSLYDRDFKKDETVLHAIAKRGTPGNLVALEDALFALPHLDPFSTEPSDYKINRELLYGLRFEGVLHRVRQRKEAALKNMQYSLKSAGATNDPQSRLAAIVIGSPSSSSAILDSPPHAGTARTRYCEATIADLSVTEANFQLQREGAKAFDEGLDLVNDPDDELVIDGWHEDAMLPGKIYNRDVDSGYASDASVYSHISETKRRDRRVDIQQLHRRLRDADPKEGALRREHAQKDVDPKLKSSFRSPQWLRKIRDRVIISTMVAFFFMIEGYRKVTSAASSSRKL